MTEPADKNTAQYATIDMIIRLVAIGIMFIATYRIISPFIMPVAWGVIIAVAVEPLIGKLSRTFGDRRKLFSTLFALLVIAAIIIPSVLLITSSIDTVQEVLVKLDESQLTVPPPPAYIAEWPVIGAPLFKSWNLASTNLDAALQTFSPQIKDLATLILAKAGGGIKTIFMFIISTAIAAALLATAQQGSSIIKQILEKIAGSRGTELQTLSTATIRGVMQGVIGVAFIQAILSVIGMVLVGVPAAGVWAVLVLIFAIIQLPPIIVLGPVAAWVFTFTSTTPAVIFLVWAIVVSGCDGFLKPVLMGRGVDAPMLVILIGALGGMMLSGIIGLFVGAVIVAISYTIFISWITEQDTDAS